MQKNQRPIGKSMRMASGLFMAAALAVPAAAADLDLRAGAYVDVEKPFVGLGLLSHAGGSIYFNPNVEYVFVDNGTLGTGNFDAHYDLPMGGDSPYVWIGAGLALVYSKPEGGDAETKPRANLLAGIGLRGHGSVPYIQAKYITGLGTWVLAAGIRF
jgi:hypothetical protein